MEINGTWYARDCIKSVGKVDIYPYLRRKVWFKIIIILGEMVSEGMFFDTQEQAEQSRKELIEQLNK